MNSETVVNPGELNDAFNDVCTGGNPQPITEEEILELYKKVF